MAALAAVASAPNSRGAVCWLGRVNVTRGVLTICFGVSRVRARHVHSGSGAVLCIAGALPVRFNVHGAFSGGLFVAQRTYMLNLAGAGGCLRSSSSCEAAPDLPCKIVSGPNEDALYGHSGQFPSGWELPRGLMCRS